MSESRIWVLVADGETARLYCGDGKMGKLTPAIFHELHAMDFVSARPVTPMAPVFDEADIWNEPVEMWDTPEPLPVLDTRTPFADQLARLLRDGASDGAYDGLVIAAPPGVMGRLDRALTVEARARLMGRVADDLMHLGPTGLSAYLRHHVLH